MSTPTETYRYTFTVTPLTDDEAQAVIDDIRARFGRKHLIHVIARQPSNTHLDDTPTTEGTTALTFSERRTALLAAEGNSNPRIADLLHIQVSTVEQHLTKAYRKLGCQRAGLARALGGAE